MELEYEIIDDKVFIFNEYDLVFLEIPLCMLIDFIEEEDINNTGDVEEDFFEQRDEDGGFEYLPIHVQLKIDAKKYLEENTKETVILYLKNLIK